MDKRQKEAAAKNKDLRKSVRKLSGKNSIYTAVDKHRGSPPGTALKKRLNEGSTAKKGKSYGGQKRHQNLRAASRDMKRHTVRQKTKPFNP
jgi:hypothetical protein